VNQQDGHIPNFEFWSREWEGKGEERGKEQQGKIGTK